jgi:hypothetical protein
LDVGCWMLDVGCWMLDVGCGRRMLAVDVGRWTWVWGVGCWVLGVGASGSGKFAAGLDLCDEGGKAGARVEFVCSRAHVIGDPLAAGDVILAVQGVPALAKTAGQVPVPPLSCRGTIAAFASVCVRIVWLCCASVAPNELFCVDYTYLAVSRMSSQLPAKQASLWVLSVGSTSCHSIGALRWQYQLPCQGYLPLVMLAAIL